MGYPHGMPARAATILVACLAGTARGQSPNLPRAPGRDLVIRVCSQCHAVATFAGLRLTRAEWSHEVDGMIARGARANRKEARRIVAYLSKHFGPAAPAPGPVKK